MSWVWRSQWDLVNKRSSVNFIYIMNGYRGELHGFGSLVGFVSAEGAVHVDIDLDSVAALVEIAGLKSISGAVPVSLHLVFAPAGQSRDWRGAVQPPLADRRS
tara:strand:+ start:20004 stop:20312 length:309 start_codon:yes stop_codon:yes gene_type:complete